jgi:hypothetical protein
MKLEGREGMMMVEISREKSHALSRFNRGLELTYNVKKNGRVGREAGEIAEGNKRGNKHFSSAGKNKGVGLSPPRSPTARSHCVHSAAPLTLSLS